MLVKFVAPLAGLALAMITHSFHNTLASFAEGFGGLALGTFIDWSGWLFMFLFTVWAIRREGKLLPKHLLEEVAAGHITTRQLQTAASPFGASFASLNVVDRWKVQGNNAFLSGMR